MAITGNLVEFSLAEIFQFLDHHQGSGLLSIHVPGCDATEEAKTTYVWLKKGQIVAVGHALDNQGLTRLISQRGWLKSEEILELAQLCPHPSDTPLGLWLHSSGAIAKEQLKLLFYVQVLLPACALFKLKEGVFVFDTLAATPSKEMTGFSLKATEATLLGLRVLRDWAPLSAKLPLASLVLRKAVCGYPHLKLDSQEWQVWELIDGVLSLEAIAVQLDLPIETVQQIACRLQMVGLVEESPNGGSSITMPRALVDKTIGLGFTKNFRFGQSFVDSLIGFFRNRKFVEHAATP